MKAPRKDAMMARRKAPKMVLEMGQSKDRRKASRKAALTLSWRGACWAHETGRVTALK